MLSAGAALPPDGGCVEDKKFGMLEGGVIVCILDDEVCGCTPFFPAQTPILHSSIVTEEEVVYKVVRFSLEETALSDEELAMDCYLIESETLFVVVKEVVVFSDVLFFEEVCTQEFFINVLTDEGNTQVAVTCVPAAQA